MSFDARVGLGGVLEVLAGAVRLQVRVERTAKGELLPSEVVRPLSARGEDALGPSTTPVGRDGALDEHPEMRSEERSCPDEARWAGNERLHRSKRSPFGIVTRTAPWRAPDRGP